MLADRRASALATNFAAQWLQLRSVKAVTPDVRAFPEFDDTLREAFQQETELFVESNLRENRPVAELLTANYTFLNERLARHYGVPHVYGNHFRRVTLTDETRFGLLGQGSILTVTSGATRTSPVLRGKWILDNILGMPPPPPPPNVPALDDSSEAGRPVSVREQLERHRRNPACATCHVRMDPLGFSLENFDGVGKWRTADSGVADRRVRRVPGRPHVSGPAGPARAPDGADAARPVRGDADREAHDLRARPGRRGLRPAGGAKSRTGCRLVGCALVRPHSGHRDEHAVPAATV